MAFIQLSDRELSYFEKLIQREITLYSTLLKSLRAELRTANESHSESAYSVHMGDAASLTTERDSLFSQMQMHSEKLTLLENALQRIKLKTYGICQKTGKKISRERLEAIPYTNVCLEDAV